MDKLVIQGRHPLNGEVAIGGAKNAVLPLMFATLLCDGEHVFHNVPRLKDVESAILLLESLGCEVQWQGHTLRIHVRPADKNLAHYDLVRKMRASILCLGPMLARYKSAEVSLPGGCAIGTRPIDLHLDAMKMLGAEVEIQNGYVRSKTSGLKGCTILFENVTVGGTENVLMAASLADGETIIENAAKEPEIVDLAEYLIKMGAKIEGAGTSVIKVTGVDALTPAEHHVIPDRIEAGTMLIAGAICSGQIHVTNCEPRHLDALIQKMKDCGAKLEVGSTSITVHGGQQLVAQDISTAPYPLFPTDLQAQMMVMMTQAHGTSVISETVFENRFMHVQELSRLNADITPKTRVAVVRGPSQLKGAPVMATDLRASACLALAGLVAEGSTDVKRIYHLDRGYEKLEEKLTKLGAKVQRTKE